MRKDDLDRDQAYFLTKILVYLLICRAFTTYAKLFTAGFKRPN